MNSIIIPTIHLRSDELRILVGDQQSQRHFSIEHSLKLDLHKECNMTYMVNAKGEFRAWRYAELQSSQAPSTGWLTSPALATLLHLSVATLSAAELSFAARLSLLPSLFSGFGDVYAGDIAELIARLESARRTRDAASRAYTTALYGEVLAAIAVFVALEGGGVGLLAAGAKTIRAPKTGAALIYSYLNAKDKQRSLDLAEEAVKAPEAQLEGRRASGDSLTKREDSGSSSGSGGGSSSSGSSSSGKSGGSGTGDDSGGGPHSASADQCRTYQQDKDSTLTVCKPMPNPEGDEPKGRGPRSYAAVTSTHQDSFYPNPDDPGSPVGPRSFGWASVATGKVSGELRGPFQINVVIPSEKRIDA
jgi:hypothetical protein